MTDIARLHALRQIAKPGWMFKPELRAAIRSGCKTMTRRIEDKPKYAVGDVVYMPEPIERWADCGPGDSEAIAFYSDDKEMVSATILFGEKPEIDSLPWIWRINKLSSMLMPRDAARTFLRIVEVRRERLNEMTANDAIAEGISKTDEWKPSEVEGRPFEEKWWDDFEFWNRYPQQIAFPRLWNKINTKHGTRWEDNPVVTVYRFEVIRD